MKSTKLRHSARLLFLLFLVVSRGDLVHGEVREDISLEGGDTTVDDATRYAFSHPLMNLSDSGDLLQHDLGEEGFRRDFARVPIEGQIRLGPKFNNVSCVSCHTNNGRGEVMFGRGGSKAVVKVSQHSGKPLVPGGPIPLAQGGVQLRDHSLKGTRADAKISLKWKTFEGLYPDGSLYRLRKPLLRVRAGTFPRATMQSLRSPPPIFGSGLIDAVDGDTMASLADPQDVDGDGISGRVNLVWDVATKKTQIGKFGWKAASPSASQQIATAYAIDMGVTNPLISLGARSPDIDQQILDRTIYYSQTLAVPKARDQDLPAVKRGRDIFVSLQCSACHVMTLVTGRHVIKEVSNQTIHPFSDLLLHDMGSGLADERPEFAASGTEWRTPPLWGIGLTREALGGNRENYLHDGRARSLEEAILWHGGESESSRQGFESSTAADRQALIRFLRAL